MTFRLLYSNYRRHLKQAVGEFPTMPNMNRSSLSRSRRLAGLVAGLLGLSLLVMLTASAAEAPRQSFTAENVRQLQTKYEQERAAADKDERTRKFSTEWYDRAAKLAKQGSEALTAGRLVEARESFRRARWNLPGLPPHLPEHIARIFGDARLRFTGPVLALAYSPDGHRLVTAGGDATVRVWDTSTGHEVCRYNGHNDGVYAVAFSPDGKTIASADKTSIEIKLWDAATGKHIKGLQEHKTLLYSLAFSPDGKLLAAGGGDKDVRIYEVATA